MNKSTLWEIRKSPAHYKWLLDHPRADTQAYKLGRAIHCAVLTPDQFDADYIKAPAVDRRTKEGKAAYEAFLTESQGKEVLSPDDFDLALSVADAVIRNQDAVDLLTDCITEQPVFYTDDQTGIECKCRIDAWKPGIMIDLKTATDASTDVFTREALRYGYDVQASHYMQAYQAMTGEMPDFYFIVVEKTAPYAVNVLKADIGFTDHGYIVRADLMETLQKCREKDEWNGYGKNALILPSWME